MMVINKEKDPIMISLQTAEKVLAVRDYVEKSFGKRMGFEETINYVISEMIEKENLLDKLHEYKKKKKNI